MLEQIRRVGLIFSSENKRMLDVYVSFRAVKDIDLVGVLFLFKSLEYSLTHRCFRMPTFDLNICEPVQKGIKKYGFEGMLKKLTKNADKLIAILGELKVEKTDEFIVAPIVMNANKDTSQKRNEALMEIIKYYNDKSITGPLLMAFTELYTNYISHAEEESPSVIAVHGNKNYIEIVCADTGRGIVGTLRPLFPQKVDYLILGYSLNEGITSKRESSHMGQGLWMISKLIRNTEGRMDIYSERGYVSLTKSGLYKSQCALWKGTIIYCKIPINKGLCIALLPGNEDIKLNIQ